MGRKWRALYLGLALVAGLSFANGRLMADGCEKLCGIGCGKECGTRIGGCPAGETCHWCTCSTLRPGCGYTDPHNDWCDMEIYCWPPCND
jgi:hypothetical protein